MTHTTPGPFARTGTSCRITKSGNNIAARLANGVRTFDCLVRQHTERLVLIHETVVISVEGMVKLQAHAMWIQRGCTWTRQLVEVRSDMQKDNVIRELVG